MHTIFKVFGVSTGAIPILHNALEQPGMRTQEGYRPPEGPSIPNSNGVVPYAAIMKSEFHPQSGTYTVTIWFNLVIKRIDGTPFYPPLSALEEVFKSIDLQLLPDSKAIEAEAEHAAAEKAREAARKDLVEKIVNEIIGETSEYDIVNSKTGQIIIPARRKITRTLIMLLSRHIADLDLSTSIGTDDRVINILRRFQSEQGSAQQR